MRDRQGAEEILLRAGPQISRGPNEQIVKERADGHRTECGDGTMGEAEEQEESETGEEAVSDRKRVAIYLRVSTVEQETDLQESELREYCERRGWEPILYRDKGQSGAKESRPALNDLLRDLRQRKVDVILVWSLDRLARSLKQLLAVSEECRALGVDLVSLRQNIDTTLPAGRLTFQVLGAVSEFEREMLRTRVKSGMAQARRAGKRIGRPALRHFSSIELERIRSLRRQGVSVRKLAKDFATTQWTVAKLVAPSNAGDGVAA
jgi:DNA invertase Pin-like site-specific DNA recombinase